MKKTLRDIIKAIDEFAAECQILESTDTGDAWGLFGWIKRQAEEALGEETGDHS